jgi:hypothetical protein
MRNLPITQHGSNFVLHGSNQDRSARIGGHFIRSNDLCEQIYLGGAEGTTNFHQISRKTKSRVKHPDQASMLVSGAPKEITDSLLLFPSVNVEQVFMINIVLVTKPFKLLMGDLELRRKGISIGESVGCQSQVMLPNLLAYRIVGVRWRITMLLGTSRGLLFGLPTHLCKPAQR